MKDALKEQIKNSLKEKATLDADQVVNMIQFGHPFKVVDEEIPPELPGPETRRYANVSNAVVDKADKKSNKAMAKAEKDTLVPTQTKEEVVIEQEGGVTDDSGYTRYPSTGNWAGIKGTTYKKNLKIAQTKQTAQDKERDALIKAVAKSPKQQALAKKQSEEIEIDEGKMEEFHALIKQGKSADEIAKILELDVKSIKALMPEQISIEDTVAKVMGLKINEWGNSPLDQVIPKYDGRRQIPQKKQELSLTPAGEKALRTARDKPKEPEVKTHVRITKDGRKALARAAALERDKKNQNEDPVGKQHEIAPPGWGHTKAEKSKTDPSKPKSKIGGSIEAMKKAQERGDIPKDMNIFALAWSMKNKGDNPHYKPGEKDVLKKKYKGPKGQNEENLLDSAKRYLIQEKSDWNTAFKSAAQSRPAMKYKDAVSFIDTAGLNSMEKRSALKAAKKMVTLSSGKN